MKVLLYGGGGREHAIAWKLSQSKSLDKLYLCKANDGFSFLGENLDAPDFSQLAQKAKKEGINLLVVGPEAPLSEGIVDEFKKVGICSIGADKKWASLESSKSFAKEFMSRHNIPTAGYELIERKEDISSVLDKFSFPLVIKADGLAAGKGVSIVSDRQEAQDLLDEFLEGKFGSASKKIVIEEFLDGEELSVIAIWDGKTLLPFIGARDHKRLEDNDQGPNTGGMGAYCPVTISEDRQVQLNAYLDQLQSALRGDRADFVGIIYSGLMMTKNGIKVLEYNMRFGDPETQPLMMSLDSDLLEIFKKAVNKELKDVQLKWKDGKSLCVVVAASGYPEAPLKGALISNSSEVEKEFGVTVFYAGVKSSPSGLLSNGGRVLAICKTSEDPYDDVYNAAAKLEFKDKIYRKDIGRRLCQK